MKEPLGEIAGEAVVPLDVVRPRRVTQIALVAVALGVGTGIVMIARNYNRPDPPAAPTAPGMTVGSNSVTLAPSAPAWSMVKLGVVEKAPPHWSDPVPGRIAFDEAHTSRLGSPLAGRVTAVFVERGQRVAQGAPLFTVSSPGLAELRADIEKANVRRATAVTSHERVAALVEGGSLPAKELVVAHQELAEADLAVRLANQKLASLKVTGAGDAAFTVTAPRDGVVVEKGVAVGQNVDSATGSVVAIADLGDVWAVADLFESDVGTLAVGAQAKVMIGNAELDAAVDQISSVVDAERHTVPVRVRLPNPDGALRPNAFAQLRFLDANPAKLAVPASAVIADGQDTYVYVQTTSGQLVRRTVIAASPNGGRVPIVSGLSAGQSIVVQGGILLDNQINLDN